MKAFNLILFLSLIAVTSKAQTIITLDTVQSMIMTGKGKGQDATINPYYGMGCIAVVKNLGELEFSIRVQQNDSVIRTIPILKNEVKEVPLLKGFELYLDPNPQGKAMASVAYKKIKL